MYEMGDRETAAAERVIKRGRFFRYGGREVKAFEAEWSAKMGVRHALAVTSGTAALVSALKAMGVGPGDSVLVPGYTFVSTALAVTAVGAIPICTEIDHTLTMDPLDMETKITSHTACVIPVHMQGMACDMRAVKRIANAAGIRVLEDACQACGGEYRGRRLGSIGDMGVYSFNEYKIISCGEGGAVVTNDKALAERAYMAHDGSCGAWPETPEMSEAFFCGGSFRANELNAAVLRVQVRRLDGILKRLRRTRLLFLERIKLPACARIVNSHDQTGDCGVCFLVQCETLAAAEAVEKAIGIHLEVHRPINSGRHVYSAWGVVNSRIGGHNGKWDCFSHPANRMIKTNYDISLCRTDDLLARTVLCSVPYRWPAGRIKETIDKINRSLQRLKL